MHLDALFNRPSLSVLACAALVSAALGSGCGHKAPNDPRYPRRAPGCELTVYHTAVPGIAAWDDLGVAEAYCNIADPVSECMRVLKAEACGMGGDILYNVPRKPLRPRDRVMQLIGQVAHTRTGGNRQSRADGESPPAKDDDAPPPATPEETAGPVVPLPSAHPPGADPEPAPSATSEKAPAP